MFTEEYKQVTNQTQGGMGAYIDKSQLTGLSIRLDTEKLLNRISMQIKNQEVISVEDENGNITFKTVQKKTGRPLANDEGSDRIIGILGSFLNPQIVQGNIAEKEDYEREIYDIHTQLAEIILLRMEDWDIQEYEYPMLMLLLTKPTRLFLTRLFENLERESYSNWFKQVDTTVQQAQHKKGIKETLGM